MTSVSAMQSELQDLLKYLSEDDKREIDRLLPRQPFTLADLWIQTKGDDDTPPEIIPFAPNVVQQLYLDVILPDWRNGTPSLRGLREIDLKARQFGFSTLIEALFFLDTVNNSNKSTVLIAHDGESTEILFGMVQRFYDYLPDDGRKPRTSYANKRELVFPDLNSSIRVLTAGTKTSGRARTIHNLHMSEFAFWEHDEVITGLLQAVPASGTIFIETTANGRGNQFYKEYQRAKDGESVFTARFFPWWMHHEYVAPVPEDFERTDEEQERVDLYGVTNEQLQWYRRKRMEPGMGDMTAQEYPYDDDEAFRVSGGLFFDTFKDEAPTVITPLFLPVAGEQPPHWYTARGGLDWGFADPYAWVIAVTDERGRPHVLESYEQARLTNEVQAEKICLALARWGIDKSKFVLLADGSMWNRKTINAVQFPPDIQAFIRAGLHCWPTSNGEDAIKARNSGIRRRIADPDGIFIYSGYNGRLIECLENAKHDPKKREFVLHNEHSHLIVALGNAISSTTRSATEPAGETEDDVWIRPTPATGERRTVGGRERYPLGGPR